MATLNLGLRFNRRGLVGWRKLWVTFGGRRGVEVQEAPLLALGIVLIARLNCALHFG